MKFVNWKITSYVYTCHRAAKKKAGDMVFIVIMASTSACVFRETETEINTLSYTAKYNCNI